MKKISVAVIGDCNKNTNDLCLAAKKAGFRVKVFKIKNIKFKNGRKQYEALCKNDNVMNFDIIIFRGYNLHIQEAKKLAKMLVRKGKIVIERQLAGEYVRDKIQQAKIFTQKKISHPATFQGFSQKQWEEILGKMSFPIIAKAILGRKGRDIYKLNSKEEAADFFLKNPKGYLAQQYFSIKSDSRIFVVGGVVIGGFQRFILNGEFRSNAHGTPAKAINVSKSMAEIAKKAAKACGYEVAGVDLMKYRGKNYIIEVNVAPQWEKFKKITKINPAKYIIKYAIERYWEKRIKNQKNLEK